MATESIETELRLRPLPAPRLSSAWMPRKLTPAASASLDIMRAVAACAVMFGHVRALFFVDFQHVEWQSWPIQALYFLTGFGHQAVIVFFVLSGFFISSSILRSHVLGEWSWHEYAILRGTRLYVVLLPGLALGFFWDRLGSWLFANKALYSHPLVDLGLTAPLDSLNLGAFLGNLLFLQTIFCQPFGSNGPLWSLSNEFWYYVLFPLAFGALLALARKRLRSAVPLVVLSLGVFVLLDSGKWVGFAIWLAGFVLVLLYKRIEFRPKSRTLVFLIASTALLCGILFVVRTSKGSPDLSDLAVGFAFTVFLFAVLQFATGESSSGYALLARHSADFSYSLYVLHFPFVLFLRAWLVPQERWQPTGAHLLTAGLVALATLTFAWLVSLVTEKKTGAARKWVKKAWPSEPRA
jgi:peptidoglycan/LPS O-acetylase OafA/YrhL